MLFLAQTPAAPSVTVITLGGAVIAALVYTVKTLYGKSQEESRRIHKNLEEVKNDALAKHEKCEEKYDEVQMQVLNLTGKVAKLEGRKEGIEELAERVVEIVRDPEKDG